MPAPDWTLTEFRGRQGLRSLETDWRRLYGATPHRTGFISFEAASGYLDHCLEDPDQVRCLVLGDGREARAICVLEPRTERRLGFQVGVWGVLWLNRHPMRADIVCPDDEVRRAFVPRLAAYLRRRPEGRRILVLGPLEPDSPLWEGVERLHPWDVCTDTVDPMRLVDCRNPYAQLEAGFTRNFRHQMKAVRKRLAELPDLQVKVARGAGPLAAELPRFLDLEASGWKGRGGTSIRHVRGQAGFHAWLVAALDHREDFCEIAALCAGDRRIASAFIIRTGDTAIVLHIAYDETYRKFSPGNALIARVLERYCADPGVERANFVSDAPWMHGWPSELLVQQVGFVNVGGWLGRCLTLLLRFRLGPLRRLVRRVHAALRRRQPRPAPPGD
jgi:hypothetical protein